MMLAILDGKEPHATRKRELDVQAAHPCGAAGARWRLYPIVDPMTKSPGAFMRPGLFWLKLERQPYIIFFSSIIGFFIMW
jgi:hypothetical protein